MRACTHTHTHTHLSYPLIPSRIYTFHTVALPQYSHVLTHTHTHLLTNLLFHTDCITRADSHLLTHLIMLTNSLSLSRLRTAHKRRSTKRQACGLCAVCQVNSVYAAQCGLPADFLGSIDTPSGSEKAVVSGLVAMYTFLGSLLAMAGTLVCLDHWKTRMVDAQ